MAANGYLKKMAEEFMERSKDHFLSYAEIVNDLGFDASHLNLDAYLHGWYDGELVTWDEYLLKRYKKEYPDDPELEYFYCDPSNLVFDFYVDDDVLNGF